jgi:hypothetical protein
LHDSADSSAPTIEDLRREITAAIRHKGRNPQRSDEEARLPFWSCDPASGGDGVRWAKLTAQTISVGARDIPVWVYEGSVNVSALDSDERMSASTLRGFVEQSLGPQCRKVHLVSREGDIARIVAKFRFVADEHQQHRAKI